MKASLLLQQQILLRESISRLVQHNTVGNLYKIYATAPFHRFKFYYLRQYYSALDRPYLLVTAGWNTVVYARKKSTIYVVQNLSCTTYALSQLVHCRNVCWERVGITGRRLTSVSNSFCKRKLPPTKLENLSSFYSN